MRNINQWVIVNLVKWLLPLAVIFVLFLVFKESSYFDFFSDKNNEVLRYGGPIGAYIFLFALGSQLMPKFKGKAEKPDLSANYKDLLGEWDVTSISQDNQTVYEAKLLLSNAEDGLLIEGKFNHVEDAISNYASDMISIMTKVDGSKLHIVYRMEDNRKKLIMNGYSVLNIDGGRKNMDGYWHAAGSDKRGTVTYTKIEKVDGGNS